jgi:hypothetical protein
VQRRRYSQKRYTPFLRVGAKADLTATDETSMAENAGFTVTYCGNAENKHQADYARRHQNREGDPVFAGKRSVMSNFRIDTVTTCTGLSRQKADYRRRLYSA